MTQPVRVLFVDLDNSVRSQIAEAWLRHLATTREPPVPVLVRSAGTDPRHLHPLATAVMQEVEIDIGRQRGQGLATLADERFDLLVTLCDVAVDAVPDDRPRATTRRHHPVDDPAFLEDPEAPDIEAFRTCRDELRTLVETLLADLTPA